MRQNIYNCDYNPPGVNPTVLLETVPKEIAGELTIDSIRLDLIKGGVRFPLKKLSNK